jgi:hypothetical protein
LLDAAVFDLSPLKVTVCSIPLKVDEKRNTEKWNRNRKWVIREGRQSL